ncbi:MAG TPA: plastocyanin/azurin family copper-binding protein [Acidimicrobiales bacterium]|nr:plastocyanin/azurin family copper-binding protein [Acidimicrobiales bacterium]
MTRKAITAIAGFALLFGVSACGGSGDDKAAAPTESSASASGNQVTIKTFAFQPKPAKVKVGDSVTWTNADDILHTVTSGTRGNPDGKFDQKLDGVGAKAMFTFANAGTFSYHCSIHPGMDATVEVS